MTIREEIIILLTVRIIKDQNDMAEDSEEVLQDVERYRVGMRQGVRWWGRERLAHAHYEWALEHLDKGSTSQALWDLDLAINNNPKLLVAIKLKEELINKRQWEEDDSSIRSYLLREIAKEEGIDAPIFGRPLPRPLNKEDEAVTSQPAAEMGSAIPALQGDRS
jgi:hypothetical protein